MTTKINIQPMAGRILVLKDQQDKKTTGGIYIPDNTKEQVCTGIVTKVGPPLNNDNNEEIPITLKINDHVIFQTFKGIEVNENKVDYMVLTEPDILAIIEETEANHEI